MHDSHFYENMTKGETRIFETDAHRLGEVRAKIT